MINSSMKREEMQVSAVNGSEKLLSAADVYYWGDPDFKANPKDMKFFRASKNIMHDFGMPGRPMPDSRITELLACGAERSVTGSGGVCGRIQSNRDNPLNITARVQGFFVPPRRAVLNASKDASDAVSVSSNVDAEATETPLEPSANRDVVVEDVERVTSLHGAALVLGRNDEDRLKDAVVYALTYAASGISVLPLKAGMKSPVGALVPHGLSDASTDPVQIQKWFGNGNPNKYNVGGVMGNGLIAIDIDKKPHKNQDGCKVIKALEHELGELIASPIAQSTPSGGEHWIYKLPESVAVKSPKDAFRECGSGLDIRADGSYIVLAPSVLGDKDHEGKPQIEGQYRWNYFSTLRDWRDLLNECTLATMNDGKWFDAIVQRYGKDRKSGAVSASSNSISAVRGELKPMDEGVLDALKAIPSSVERTEWLKVLSVLSAFEGGREVAYEWSSTGAYAEHFSATAFDAGWSEVHTNWNDGAPIVVGAITNLAKAHNPDWVNPSITRAQAAQAPVAAQSLGLGDMPSHVGVNPSLEHVATFPTVEELRTTITQEGEAAWEKYNAGNHSLKNSAKWLALGLLNAEAEAAGIYQDAHPKTSKGDTRKLVADSKVEWKTYTFTAAMHIAGRALLMTSSLDGGFAGLSAASREKLVDLIYVLLLSSPIGAVWRELEASSNKLKLRKTIADACAKVQDKSTTNKPPRPGAMHRSNVSVSSNVIDDAVSTDVAPPAKRVSAPSNVFDITCKPAYLGGTSQSIPVSYAHSVSDDTPAISSLVQEPISIEPVPAIVVEESDEKESSVDRLYRLAKKEFRREWVYDPIAKAVYAPNGSGTYTRLDKDAVEREITRLKDTYGVSVRGFNDIVSARRLLEGHLGLVEWSAARHLLPFKNTVYDTEQNEKLPYDLCPKFNWQLPYDFDPRATCPVFDEFILKAVDYDPDVVKTLQAFMRCLIAGDYSVKKYVELNGPSDSGKTQYMNICVALVGRENAVSSTLKTLEDKQFETRRFYGKRLVTFPDQNRFYGDSQVFRNLTGGDAIRNEGKGVDAGDDYVFEGLVIVTANDWMNPKNNGGAIMKRRIPIEFPIAATADEIAKYAKHKGIANYIATHEMPGVMNWVLGMSLEDAQAQLRKPDAKTRELNEKVEHDNSTVLSWLQENAARCERGDESPVGKCVPAMYNSTGDKMNTQPRDYGLFADFCDHCKGIGQVAMNRINFTKEIMSVCRQRGISVEYNKERLRTSSNRDQYILTGIRLRKDADEVEFFG